MRRLEPAADDAVIDQLLRDLAKEYSSRYGRTVAEELAELVAYPSDELQRPDGWLIVLLDTTNPVASGGFRRYDSETAELKRIWVAASHRGQGLGRAILTDLEREIRARGYRRIRLQTGPAQPEAVALYLSAGYQPLFDTTRPASEIGIHKFIKRVAPGCMRRDTRRRRSSERGTD